nr:MAG TPA: hypothetical protein [Crassvirales sp.]
MTIVFHLLIKSILAFSSLLKIIKIYTIYYSLLFTCFILYVFT